jgi:pyridoxine kinase
VLVTSLRRPESSAETIEMMLAHDDSAWLVATPRLDFTTEPHGGGDLTAALILAYYLSEGVPAKALARTAAAVFAVYQATADADAAELELIAAQQALVAPPRSFTVTRLR